MTETASILLKDAKPDIAALMLDREAAEAAHLWSRKTYTFRCPKHKANTWKATPFATARRDEPWRTRCTKCSKHNRNTMAAKYPKVSRYADGWDPKTTIPNDVRKVRDWTCPKCARAVRFNISCRQRKLVDDPQVIVKACRNCTGRTLASRPRLAAQLVTSGYDGQTDPTLVSTVNRNEIRSTATTWCCSECGQDFQVSIASAVRLDDAGETLHLPCRAPKPEPQPQPEPERAKAKVKAAKPKRRRTGPANVCG